MDMNRVKELAEQGDEKSQATLLAFSAEFIKQGNKSDGLLLLRILVECKGNNVPNVALSLLKQYDPNKVYGYYPDYRESNEVSSYCGGCGVALNANSIYCSSCGTKADVKHVKNGSNRSFADKTLQCKECGNGFVFTANEQEFYAERGFTNEPQRCKICRDARKAAARGPREYFTAVCAGCGAEVKIPFEPKQNSQVYCPGCFAKQ